MSKHNKDDEEDNNECFYESLDRLVSSSGSCSTSNSDYDSDYSPPSSAAAGNDPATSTAEGGLRRRHPFPVPRFPMGASRLDVWISEPASVSERRSKLLREMGLSRDPFLSRVKPDSGSDGFGRGFGFSDFSRSVSSDELTAQNSRMISGSSSVGGGGLLCILRSKSDGAAGKRNGNDGDRDGQYQHQNSCPCSCSFTLCSRSILSIRSQADTNRTSGPAFVNNNCDCNCIHNADNTDRRNQVVVGNEGSLPNKPFMGKIFRESGNDPGDSSSLDGSFLCDSSLTSKNSRGGVFVQEVDTSGIHRTNLSEEVCTIKNLDNGKEFVVNEIQDDGTWKKLKEVGTGRQLTMEEFEMCVGHSPIVQELMRRQNIEDGNKDMIGSNENVSNGGESKFKKKGSWFKSIKNIASSVTGHKERRSSDDRETSSEKGGRRSSSATDDSQDGSFHGLERVRVRHYGKSCKELTALYKSQEIQAHNGSIWSIRFSLDGHYLASAGEDCVIHIWKVVEAEKKGELLLEKPELLLLANGSPEPGLLSPRRRGRTSISRKSLNLENIVVPDTVFGLSETPFCSFHGHLDDVLDLSWSKSQHLLSSSMDKTVRLWHLSSQTCLRVFSHSDYVTCIQFNPVDDRCFISGSLDAKIRIWSIPDRQVIDWYDMHEMVTAACYTSDGQGALVGSYKGSCSVYNTSDNKLQQRGQINLQNRKKKSHLKKITGFQFAPGSSSEVLITSADSRIRVADGVDIVCKIKGFRNTNSQISASITANGKHVVSASEDSHVYVWKYESTARPSRSKGVAVTNSYEHFHCPDVSVAIPWPGLADTYENQDAYSEDPNEFEGNTRLDEVSTANHPPTPVDEAMFDEDPSANSPRNGIISSATNGYFFDRISATWPEEKLVTARSRSPRVSMDMSDGQNPNASAWGMVIVTAGLRGGIRTFQNFGLPAQI